MTSLEKDAVEEPCCMETCISQSNIGLSIGKDELNSSGDAIRHAYSPSRRSRKVNGYFVSIVQWHSGHERKCHTGA